MEQVVRKGAETLANLLCANNGQQSGQGIGIIQRLQLAKLLTTATPNFHSTPWMQSYWGSDDIFLYDFDSSKINSYGAEPDAFVEVPVDSQASEMSAQHPHVLAPFVPNPILFNLAIILLELAFEKPLKAMIDVTDAKPGMPASTIECFAAARLSNEVATELGPKYSQLVKQCLFCNFGLGTELSNRALQGAIQKDIVSELDRLASDLQNLLVC